MNHCFKKKIGDAFHAPPPRRKKDFLRGLDYPKASRPEFFCTQAGYIRKRVWVCSALLFLALTAIPSYLIQSEFFPAFLSAVCPYFALLAVTETARSASCRMAELEMSCKHSLTQIVLARMLILGASNLFLLCGALFLLAGRSGLPAPWLAMQMLAPYLFTCAASLFVAERVPSGNTPFFCGAIALGVGLMQLPILMRPRPAAPPLFQAVCFCAVLAALIFEVHAYLKKAEEFQWNYESTV